MGQQVQLELAQPRSRIDPELVTERALAVGQHLQRLALPVAAVERHGQQRGDLLVERVAVERGAQLGLQRAVLALREPDVVRQPQRTLVHPFEPDPVRPAPVLVLEVGQQRCVAGQRRADRALGPGEVAGRVPGAGSGHRVLEAPGVDLLA